MNLDKVANSLLDYPDPRVAIESESFPLNVIQLGTARVVTDYPETGNVLKFAVGHGIEQNRSEVRITELSEQRGFESEIASVVRSADDESWIEMERVTCQEDIGCGKIVGPDSETIYNRLKDHGVLLYEIETGHMGSNTVAYDYGAVTDIKD